ncbi:MAG: hypothetical protein Q9209_001389 [Squamulea sp. 1 TL-2023]
MPSKTKPLDKDEAERKPVTKHKYGSTSEPEKPNTPFVVRIVRRVKDACEEYIERIEDIEHGRRDNMGRMTQKGLDYYYNLERRQRKRDARRREEKEREHGKHGEQGDVVKAMMSGGRGGPSRRGRDSRRGGHGDGGGGHGDTNNGDPFANPPAMEAPIREMLPQQGALPATPPPAIHNVAHRIPPAAMQHEPQAQGYGALGRRSASHMQFQGRRQRSHGSTGSRRDLPAMLPQAHGQRSHGSRASRGVISPMPSERSLSSMRAQVSPGRGRERVRIRAPDGQGPRAAPDSEDEEPSRSDEGSSSEDEDEGEVDAVNAARRARDPAAASREESTGGAAEVPLPSSVDGTHDPAGEGISGLRGGGGVGIEDLDDHDSNNTDDSDSIPDAQEYDEHEDFDDEYVTEARSHEPPEVLDGANEKNIQDFNEEKTEELHATPQKNDEHDGEPFHKQLQDPTVVETQSIFQSRERRPYSVGVQGLSAKTVSAPLQQEKVSDRTPQPYTYTNVGESTRVRRNETSEDPGPHYQHRADDTGEANQAKPKLNKARRHGKKPDPPLRRVFDSEDDSEDDSNAARASQDQKKREAAGRERRYAEFQERMKRANATNRKNKDRGKVADQERVVRGAAAAFRNRPLATPYAERVPRPRFPQQGGPYSFNQEPNNRFGGRPYGDSFGANFGFTRKSGNMPKREQPPVQEEIHDFQGESFNTSDLNETSSASETSSDAQSEPKPSPLWKKPAPKASNHENSSDSDERPPRKPAKANAGKRQARAKTPPKKNPKAQKGKGRAAGRSPPPPKYKDVVKDIPPNHYARLGLSEDATAEDIKIASKKMRVKTHPDQVKKEKPNMTEEELAKVTAISAKVNDAVDILQDPREKALYDRRIRIWKEEHGGRLPKEQA